MLWNLTANICVHVIYKEARNHYFIVASPVLTIQNPLFGMICILSLCHDDVIKWEHFPRYWPFVWGIHRSPVNSPHKGQWRGALMFSLICARINAWVNSEAGDLRRNHAHYDVTAMWIMCRADSRFAPSQWETVLLGSDVSRWLGASLESALMCIVHLFTNSHTDQTRLPVGSMCRNLAF